MKDLSLHVLDIMQNSVTAGSSRIEVSITVDVDAGMLEIRIMDNGCGMDKEKLKRVVDPFVTSRTTRKVGLGIPLFKASAERAGGTLEIISSPGKGTVVNATFITGHIDRQPLGSISDTVIGAILSKPEVDIELSLRSQDRKFFFSLKEVKEKLGELPVDNFEVLGWIREYIDEGIEQVFGGVLDEIDSRA